MAANKYMSIAKKLQAVCNKKFGIKLLINTRQWYSDKEQRAITQYTLVQVVSTENGKNSTITLFKTYSQIQLVLFLRDYWYNLNGWKIPEDNKEWKEAKKEYYESTTTH